MAVFGIDTSGRASQVLHDQAFPMIGTPRFWARYFNGTSSNLFQYTSSEHAILRKLGIPVLCIARQMSVVSDASAAAAHAKRNMKGVVDAFGAQYLFAHNIKPTLYLDLEPEHRGPNFIMSQAYYTNWSAALAAGYTAGGHTITFRPAVYLNLGQSRQSFLNLNAACVAGSVCDGVWPARYVHENNSTDEASPPPPSSAMVWNNAFLTPEPNPIPPGKPNAHIPTIVWQYYGDYPRSRDAHGKLKKGDVDFDMVNPALESVVLNGCVPVPPAGAIV